MRIWCKRMYPNKNKSFADSLIITYLDGPHWGSSYCFIERVNVRPKIDDDRNPMYICFIGSVVCVLIAKHTVSTVLKLSSRRSRN